MPADPLREALERLTNRASHWTHFVSQAERDLYGDAPTLLDAVTEARAALEGRGSDAR